MAEFKQLGVAADHVTRNPAMRQEVLNVHPNAKFHDVKHRMKEDELIDFLKDCDAAIIGFEPVTERVLSALPNLKLLITTGARNASIDMTAAAERGITVCGTGSFGNPTAGIAFGLVGVEAGNRGTQCR